MANLEEVNKAYSTVNANKPSQKQKKDTSGGLFRDPVRANRGDVGTRQDRALAQKDISPASVEGTPSKPHNSYNHLKHLLPTCAYKIQYYFTAGILTQASSVLRKSAFEDISREVAKLKEAADKLRAKAEEEQRKATQAAIENNQPGSKAAITTQIREKPSVSITYDILNIPWKLRVPKKADSALGVFMATQGQSLTEIEQALVAQDILEDHVGQLSLMYDAGRQAFACPEKVTNQGFVHMGKYTKPIFLPVVPATSYSGIFGKLLAEVKAIAVSGKTDNLSKVNTVTALAATRVCIPPTLSESEGSIPVVVPLLADYVSVVSPPLVYNAGKVNKVPGKDTAASTSLELDADWKKLIHNGELFDLGESSDYTAEGLVENEILKHGTSGLKTSDLESRIGSKKDNFVSPFLKRMSFEDNAGKAGNATDPNFETKAKTFTEMNSILVKDAIKARSWSDVVSDRYKTTLTLANVKSGTNLVRLSDVPSFHFWIPFMSSKAEDNDGSSIYSYLDPTNDNSLESTEVIYSKTPPMAFLQMGIKFTPYDQYLRGQTDFANQDPAVAIDSRVLKYGLGGFAKNSPDKFLMPATVLVNTVFQSTGDLFSVDGFPKTHLFGKKEISIHSSIIRQLIKTFGRYAYDTLQTIQNVIPASIIKSRSTSGDPKDLNFGLNDLGLLGTPIETVLSEESIQVYSDEKASVLGKEVDKTYTTGAMRKLAKVDIGEVVKAEIHFGKTLNVKGLEDNVSLQNNNIKKILVDATVATTPIISTGKKIFVTDIQPGESLVQKYDKTGGDPANPDAYKPTNQIEYLSDPLLSDFSLYTDDLTDFEAYKRINPMDIVGSFLGKKTKTNDPANQSKQGKELSSEIIQLINSSLTVNLFALLGEQNMIPSLNPDYRPLFKPLGATLPTGDPYDYKGLAQFKIGLFGSLGALLKNPEILYLEHFEDVKKNKLCLNSIAFFQGVNPDSQEYDLTEETKQVTKYVDWQDKTLQAVTPNSFDQITKPENIQFPVGEVKGFRGNISYDPWTDFNVGTASYQTRLDKFTLLSSSDTDTLAGKNMFNDLTGQFLDRLLKDIQGRAILVSSYIPRIFEEGAFALKADGSDIVSKFTSLIKYMDMENIGNEYENVDATMINTVFSSLKKKINATAVYAAVAHLKKANGSLTTDGKLAKIAAFIKTNRAQLEPLLSGKQIVDANTIGELFTSLPQTIGVVRNTAENSFVVGDFPIINVLILAIASYYVYTLVYKKGFPEDASAYEWVTGNLSAMSLIYKQITTGDTTAALIPRYELMEVSDFGTLIKYALMAKGGDTAQAEDIRRVFEKTRQLFDTWYVQREETSLFSTDPIVSIEIPKVGPLTLPICLVEIVKPTSPEYVRQRDVLKFVDFSTTQTIEDFSDKLVNKEYLLLVKKVSQEWMGTTVTGKVDLTKITYTAKNAALILNLLDYVGFAYQSMVECGKALNRARPSNPDEAPTREKNRLNRKLRLETTAEYVEDLTKDFGAGEGQRAYIVGLYDFTNMVKVQYGEKEPLIEKMYPLKLKEISPENKDTSLAPKDLIESKVVDLVAFMTPEKTRYMGAMMRPGYGFPDLVEGIGFRCIIKDFKKALYGNVTPKRFAFHGNFKEKDASLKMSRMFENAVGKNFQKIIKASEWTKSVVNGDPLKIKDQIFSTSIPAKMRSSYDNFQPSGINGTAIFDVEIGYLSTRPLFKDNLSITIPNVSVKLAFSAINVPINLTWRAGFPINLLYRIQNSVVEQADLYTATAIKGTSLTQDGKTIISSNLQGNTANRARLYSVTDKTNPNLAKTFAQLGIFGVSVVSTQEDIDAIKTFRTTDATFETVSAKLTEMISSKKLRDTGFIQATQMTFTGRTYDVPTAGAAPYPVVNPGISTQATLKEPKIENLKNISKTGHSDESLYDLNPFSFMTSPSSIGLSKRRAMFVGFASILSMLPKAKFFKDPNAKNPYCGFYVMQEVADVSEEIQAVNERKFAKAPTVPLVFYVPDFPTSGAGIRNTVATSLKVSSDVISPEPIAKYYGTGTLLNGAFRDKTNKGTKPERLTPTDALGQTSIDYTKEGMLTLLKHLKLWNEYAKTADDYFNAINGAFFNKHAADATATKKNGAIANLSKAIFKTDALKLTPADATALKTQIDTLFADFTKLPICLDGDTLCFTGSAISYLNLIKAKGSDAAKVKVIDNLIQKTVLTDVALEKERSAFLKIDLFSIMAGCRYPATGLNKQRFSLNSVFETKAGDKAEADAEVSFFQASQTYMGFSQSATGKVVMFGLGQINSNASGKAAISKVLLSPTRSFGKDVKIKDLIQTDLPYRYNPLAPVKQKVKADNNAKDLETDTEKGILFRQPAINLFKMVRLWLAYNWYSDNFKTAKIKVGDEEKLIQDVTLEDFTSINADYFVKVFGPKLATAFDDPKKVSDSLAFEELDILPKFTSGGKDLVITPTFAAENNPKGISKAPFYKKKVYGPAGIYQAEVPLTDAVDVTRLTAYNTGKDSNYNPKIMAFIWSMFAIRAFVGTTEQGIQKSYEDIIKDSGGVSNAIGEGKPGLGTITLANSRIFTDMRVWDKFSRQDKPGLYTTNFSLQGDKWNVLTATDKPVIMSSENLVTNTYEGEKIKVTIKDVASQNGLHIVSFAKTNEVVQ